MTDRLYYTDAYTTEFQARIIEHLSVDGDPAIVLDRTFFYPSSGGQPHDRGYIDNVPVVDVFVRPEDQSVIHVLQEIIKGPEIRGRIEWGRRFDHMQQHTGQHILSQALQQVTGASTVSFHLGSNHSTIDVASLRVENDVIDNCELLANQVIWENRPVNVHLVSNEEAKFLPLRSLPEVGTDIVRLVEIDNFDIAACGGTHVCRSGEVGLIKITGLERRGDLFRLSFLCGRRALLDYATKESVVNQLVSELTTSPQELVSSVARLQQDLKKTQRQLKKQTKELITLEAGNLIGQATPRDDLRIIRQVFTNRDPESLRLLAGNIASNGMTIALLASTGPSAHLVFARSQDAPGQMDRLLQDALHTLGSSAGGGSTLFAQGGGQQSDHRTIEQVLINAEQSVLASTDVTGP